MEKHHSHTRPQKHKSTQTSALSTPFGKVKKCCMFGQQFEMSRCFVQSGGGGVFVLISAFRLFFVASLLVSSSYVHTTCLSEPGLKTAEMSCQTLFFLTLTSRWFYPKQILCLPWLFRFKNCPLEDSLGRIKRLTQLDLLKTTHPSTRKAFLFSREPFFLAKREGLSWKDPTNCPTFR